MNYYLLSHNGTNLKETGTQFQSLTGNMGDIQQDFIPFSGPINFDFILPEPFLETKAKPTTYLYVMMIPGQFKVFRNYFVDELSKFRMPDYQSWDIQVFQKKEVIDGYKLFYMPTTVDIDFIDFKNSSFFCKRWDDISQEGDDIGIKSPEDYRSRLSSLSRKNHQIGVNEIVFNFKGLEFDLMRFGQVPALTGLYIVSEKFKNFIEENNFTGFAFTKPEEFNNRIKFTS